MGAIVRLANLQRKSICLTVVGSELSEHCESIGLSYYSGFGEFATQSRCLRIVGSGVNGNHKSYGKLTREGVRHAGFQRISMKNRDYVTMA